jgi:two-component system, chemotaxis family, CheB/CheR fusion protein
VGSPSTSESEGQEPSGARMPRHEPADAGRHGAQEVDPAPAHVQPDRAVPTADELGFRGRVVALGASAGGLDALDRFFAALPSCPDAAFVVVQHLSPDHRTMMDDLLRRHTSMPVAVVTQDMPLERGHVYVIAPGMMLQLEHGRLRLTPKPSAGLSLPIDAFFESVAREIGARSIGVVLSGTGSDGKNGVVALDAAGAWVLVQEPSSARFDGMPRSAMATGVVDRVLDPEALAQEVATLLEPGHEPRRAPALLQQVGEDPATLSAVLNLLARATGVDFGHYKPATVLRRLERRLHATGSASLEQYRERLKEDAREPELLRAELLIPVTAFFRDGEAFATLRDRVVRPLVQSRSGPGASPLRIWVSATATGEEAYTLAAMVEHVGELLGVAPAYKIFATDVEPTFLARASAGRYPLAAMEQVPSEYRHCFAAVDDEIQADPQLRQHIVFARHDLLADPPFTQLDLVCCRNMLIYLRPSAQERVLRRLQQSLRVGGTLFLGGSESLPAGMGPFEIVDARHKLFRLTQRPAPLPLGDLVGDASVGLRRRPAATPHVRVIDLAVEGLLSQYTPAALVITAARELVHVFGEGHAFLRIPPGGATLDVLQLLDPAVAPVLSTLAYVALRDRVVQVSRAIDVMLAGERRRLRVRVVPLKEEGATPHLVVAFEFEGRESAPEGESEAVADLPEQERRRIADLEGELAETRASLHATIQDLGTTNEELQSTNEELMAANEELQGTNEELQSVNEELHTVNAELQGKIEQLNAANADLEGLTQAGRVATVFVDGELSVLRFTPEAAPLFRLRASDIGRRLTDLAHTLAYPELVPDLEQALARREGRTREVRALDGREFLATVLPYGEAGSGGSKAVVTFVDISHLRNAEELQEVLDAQPAHIAVIDADGTIRRVNRAWRNFAAENAAPGRALALGLGTSYLAPCDAAAQMDQSARRAVDGLRAVLFGGSPGFVCLYPCHAPDEERWFLMHATPLTGRRPGAVVSHLNVTGWLDARALLHAPAGGAS